jgi:hypothetical protein
MQIGLGTLCGRRSLVAMASTCLVTTTMLGACTGGDPGAGSVRDTRSSRPAASSTASSGSSSGSSSAQPGVAESCTAAIEVAPLPAWARVGFDPPDQKVRQVHGSRGQILGVVFADPLRAPAKKGYGNKILWLVAPGAPTARSAEPGTSGDLRIDASLIGSALAVRRVVPGGPGPSLVDMPRAGCWRFDLSWDGHQDTVVLPYSSP